MPAGSALPRLIRASALALALAPATAHANGRFPNAEQLRPLASGSLAVSGTYGLLVSGNLTDFQYVCESALFGTTLMGSWVDPLLEVLPDGTILSGSPNGLRVSRDQGCSFSSDWSLPHSLTFIAPDPSATGPAGKIVDLCPAYDGLNGVLALTTVNNADGSVLEHRIYKSSDGAHSWATLDPAIPSSMVRQVFTIDVAPSDADRIYVSGNSLGVSELLMSSNGAASFAAAPVTLADNAGVLGLYIAAVSPTDPKRVYLRANRRTDDAGVTIWDDSLLVTDDGGVNVLDVLRKQAALLGFALSPDGMTVLAGYGDPQVPPETTNPDDLGLYSGSSASLTFAPQVPGMPVSCLRWTSDAHYACATETDPLGKDPSAHDFHVGRYTGSALPTALSDFTPLVKLKDVRGPLPNQDGSPSGCSTEWSSGDPNNPAQASVCTTFNACTVGGMAALSAGAIECMASAGSGGAAGGAGAGASAGASASAGQGGALAGQGGAAAQAGSAGSATGAAGSAAAASPSKGGCGCRVSDPDSRLPAWGTLAFALALLARKHRRRA